MTRTILECRGGEVMNALTVSNLEDTLRLKRKLEETSEKDWDRINIQYVVL